MNKKEKEELKKQIENDFELIQGEAGDIDVGNYLAKPEDLPNFGEIVIYDYEKDIQDTEKQGEEVLKSLVDLYLGDVPDIKDHAYIKNKMKEDASVYAETIFLNKMTRKNFLTQLKQIDGGDSSPRMHEIVNQSISQIRENSKYSSSIRTDLEKFYKEIRKDLGINDLSNTQAVGTQSSTNQEETKIVDSKSLNDMIDNYIKNKK